MADSLKQTGVVIYVGEEESITERFSKREIWLEHGDKYKNYNSFEFCNDDASKLDGIGVGQVATVHYNLRGRKWEKNGNTKVFNTLRGWRIETENMGQEQDGEKEADSLPF